MESKRKRKRELEMSRWPSESTFVDGKRLRLAKRMIHRLNHWLKDNIKTKRHLREVELSS